MTNIDLFELGKQYFDKFLKEFASYGIHADPGFKLCNGTSIFCHYNLEDGNVYLSPFDVDSPIGKLQLLFIRSLLGCETDEEVFYFFELMMPRLIAHEMAHHFRHRYGVFGSDMWHEEQVANQLATAVTKHRSSVEEREKAGLFLKRSIVALEEKMQIQGLGTGSYYNIWESLGVSGEINDAILENMELAHELFLITPKQVLDSGGLLSPEMVQRLESRENVVGEVSEEYASNFMQYVYYQLSWMYLDVTSNEKEYVEEFGRQHLGVYVSLLPTLPKINNPSEESILATFKAYQDTLALSKAASHYFYKRYRALLLARLQSESLPLPGQAERLRRESGFLLENWGDGERDADMLNYISYLAPPSLRCLFPQQIADHIPPCIPIQMHLPTDTDRRLWQHVVLQEYDNKAKNTLERLSILDGIEIYRSLPAEVVLELIHIFCRIILTTGESVIWQGEINGDIYILISGRLEVVVTTDGQDEVINVIEQGDAFGEISFFTGMPRNASVKASENSECFVLRRDDLHNFAYKYSDILIQMARRLTRRLVQIIESD